MREFSIQIDPMTGEKYIEPPFTGYQLVENPIYNKGSAFPESERDELNLSGIIPNHISTMEQQVKRAYENYSMKTSSIQKYIYLLGLLDRNETLFYRLVLDNAEEMLPIVYTPTVGEAAKTFSHLFRRPRGLYIPESKISKIDQILTNVPFSNVKLIVITDGERILGLGDQGIGGMSIPIGKISLYVVGGGIHPALTLPILLDVGTNNEELLEDPLYLGVRHKRLTGNEYDRVVEEVINGVKRNFPHALFQWEDFGKHNALHLLERYKQRLPSFNDDIQGTGAVTFAALYSAIKKKNEKLSDQIYVFFGFGQAGYGIANTLTSALKEEGLTEKEARELIYPIGSRGLVFEDMDPHPYQKPFARTRNDVSEWDINNKNKIDLLDTVKNSKATVLIGASGVAGAFNEKVLKQMAENTDKPIIFALSNPNDNSECTPEEAFKHTRGKCILATGSPFPPVKYNDKEHKITQCNNMYIFPGVGLGTIVSMSSRITDNMFISAAKSLAKMNEGKKNAPLLPEIDSIRKVSRNVALAVAKEARESGLGISSPDEKLTKAIKKSMWNPHYIDYRPKKQ